MTEEEIRTHSLWMAIELEKLNETEVIDPDQIITLATQFETFIKGV